MATALRAQRTERWGKELLDPKAAGVAALRLEGLGLTAIEALKAGLASPNAQVRFWSAEALAYLDDASGVDSFSIPLWLWSRAAPHRRAHTADLRPGAS